MHYLFIVQEKIQYDIKLDISSEFPKNMTVYYVECNERYSYNDPDNLLYGEVDGKVEDIDKLEKNLIHRLYRNN